MKGMRVEDQVLSIEDGDTRDARMRGIISITFMPVMNLPSSPDINNCPKEKDVYGKKKKRNKEEKREQKGKIGKREKEIESKEKKEQGKRKKREARKSPSRASYKLLPQMCDFS